MTKNRTILAGVLAAVVAVILAVWLIPVGSTPAGKGVVLDNEAPTPSSTLSSEAVATEEPTPEPSPTASPTTADGGGTAEDVIYRVQPSVNGDGSMVAFVVAVPWETGELHSDVYVRSRSSHSTTLISISSDGESGNLDSWNPAISADGTKVAYISTSSNLVPEDTNDVADVFVRDLVKHTTTRISVSSDGRQATATSGFPFYATGDGYPVGHPPALSEDGRYIAFVSQEVDLAPGDTSNEADVFRHDLSTGETILVSAGPDGMSADDVGPNVSISADGRFVAFDAEDLSPPLPPTGNARRVYVRDIQEGTTTLVSLDDDGEPLSGVSSNAAVAADGRSVAFVWRHVEQDQETWDVMKRILSPGSTTTIATCGVDACGEVALSVDGSVAAFTKYLGGLDPFCYIAGATPQYLGSCDGDHIAVSANGRWIAFEAGLDSLSDPADEEKFGGNYGAMLYDRSNNDYTAAWLI